ncbi:Stk1 family PASTA domain-containing Ser/Thr kinase [Alloscardovia macacae]|uniref:non-specific serine/threonine protein kinase n=1 Tax=Alloscardovia macacae TaxID=1160091 RepID=A0A261F5Z7_9BIFI|nr:Stk1 family PASTA domain-containing Ser/Thr kinase [Alloscardovia macacae]OZG54326.1 kinase [Alloscardovia macacae]
MSTPFTGYIHQVLDNRYLIVRKIAEGGMASVFEATDQRLNKRVAVKIMHTALAYSDHSEQYVERFHREALSAAAIDNPHIVHVFDAGSVENVGYIVMEYVDGQTLRDLMRAQSTFSVGQMLTILDQILDGLAAAHSLDIIHRDMKPENIMLNARGEVQIADFGLAKQTDNATVAPTGMFVGTSTYVAPETASANESLPASDLYAVGLMAWEMLLGRPPFTGASPVTVVYKHVNEDVPPLTSLAPSVPRSVSEFVTSLCARSASARPQNAQLALQALRSVRAHLASEQLRVRVLSDGTLASPAPRVAKSGTPAGPASAVPRPPAVRVRARGLHWLRAHPTTSAVSAVLLSILLIAGFVSWWNTFGPGSYVLLPAPTDVTCTSSSCTLQGANASSYEKLLKDQSISYTVQRAASDSVESGKIISSTPEHIGDHIAKSGGSVTLTVSTGIQQLTIPSDILDSSSANGKDPLKTLKSLGFTKVQHSTDADQYSLTVPSGAALDITPKPGARINHNAEITVVLSRGLKTVTMPDVTGLSRGDALAALNELRLTTTVKETYSSEVETGKVISQSASAGDKLKWNDKVTITVSKGAQTVTIPDVRGMSTARARTTLEDLGLKVTVKSQGGDSIARQSLSPGDTVSVTDGKGNARGITLTTTEK